MAKTTRVRVVIEYDVPAGSSGKVNKEQALKAAETLAGRERLKFVSYEVVKSNG